MTVDQPSIENNIDNSSPGFRLQQAREAAGLSPAAVADGLKITEAKLHALESNQYDKLVSDTFVRGYIRNYAKLVDLDGDSLINHYKIYIGQVADTAAGTKSVKSKAKNSIPIALISNPLVIVSSLLFVWVVAYYSLVENTEATEPVLSNTPVVQSDTEASASSISDHAALPAEKPETVNPAEHADQSIVQSVAEQQSVDSAPPVDPGLAAATGSDHQPAQADSPVASQGVGSFQSREGETESAVSGNDSAVNHNESSSLNRADTVSTVQTARPSMAEDRLVMQFSDECWVEVTDAKGDVLFTDLRQAGESLSLSGVAPFKLMLGNVRAVKVNLNGSPVNVRPEGNRKTLRLTVGG